MAQSASSSLGGLLTILICKTLHLFYREVHIKWKNKGLVSITAHWLFHIYKSPPPDRLQIKSIQTNLNHQTEWLMFIKICVTTQSFALTLPVLIPLTSIYWLMHLVTALREITFPFGPQCVKKTVTVKQGHRQAGQAAADDAEWRCSLFLAHRKFICSKITWESQVWKLMPVIQNLSSWGKRTTVSSRSAWNRYWIQS